MQNHDRERQEEVEEAAELWRLQETSARHKNNREEGESQTVITRQHEVLSNTLQGGNSERNERNQRRKETEDTQTEQTTAHSPLILQGCNSHTRDSLASARSITALFGSAAASQRRRIHQDVSGALKTEREASTNSTFFHCCPQTSALPAQIFQIKSLPAAQKTNCCFPDWLLM